jgi:predicted DCC family thiol-disulfide oxidoreductase YuxK
LLVYDGDCGVCTRLAGYVERRLRPDAGITAWQHADLPSLGLTAQQCDEALQYVEPSGRISSAQVAVARLLLDSRPIWKPLGALLLVPGVRQLAGVVYRWVAKNRHRLPGGTPACSLPAAQRPGASTASTSLPSVPD